MSRNDRWNAGQQPEEDNPWSRMKAEEGWRPRGRIGRTAGKMDMTYLIVLLAMAAAAIGLFAISR